MFLGIAPAHLFFLRIALPRLSFPLSRWVENYRANKFPFPLTHRFLTLYLQQCEHPLRLSQTPRIFLPAGGWEFCSLLALSHLCAHIFFFPAKDYSFLLSMVKVTGPSFSRYTFIYSLNTPCSTFSCESCKYRINSRYNFSAKSGAAA